MRSFLLFVLSCAALGVTVSHLWVIDTVAELKEVQADRRAEMERREMEVAELRRFIDLLMSVVEDGRPEKGTPESIALAGALKRFGATGDPCVRKLAMAVIRKGEYTAERIAEIERLKEECFAER